MIKALGECVEIFDSKRIPLSASDRRNLDKIYPYYGAQGVIDYVDRYLFDGDYLLVAEDGNNLKTLDEPIANLVSGKFWVNNHAHILGEKKGYDLKYIYYLLNSLNIRGFITGSAQPKLNQENLLNIELSLPSYEKQKNISGQLYLIDKKINNCKLLIDKLESISLDLFVHNFIDFSRYETTNAIPKGWIEYKLGDLFEFEKGKIPKETSIMKNKDFSIPYLTIDAINNKENLYVSNDNIVETNGEVLMVVDGAASSDVYIGYNGAIGSTLCKLKLKNKKITNELLYLFLKFYNKIFKMVNTGSTVPHANKDYILDFKIYLPNLDENQVVNQISVYYKNISYLKDEIKLLTSSKELLLHKLLFTE